MTPPTSSIAKPAKSIDSEQLLEVDDSVGQQAILSTALVSIFRGNFCDFILPNRKSTSFKKHSVIYDVGDRERTLYFLQNGFAKVGTITADGSEIIYDVRKKGDVVGELCVSAQMRPDRAVALENTDAICVSFAEVVETLLQQPGLAIVLVEVFCRALKEAYAQVNSLVADDTIHRLIRVLSGLAAKIGERSGSLAHIPVYLTQEEIAQMAGARRERISTALNSLRRRGIVHYSVRGHLVLDLDAIAAQST